MQKGDASNDGARRIISEIKKDVAIVLGYALEASIVQAPCSIIKLSSSTTASSLLFRKVS